MTQDFAKKKTSPKSTKSRPSSSTAKKAVAKKAPKRKTNTRKKQTQSKRAPAWAWLLIGVLVGGFVMFLSNISSKSAPTKPVEIIEQIDVPEKVTKEDSQVKFDFYDILKDHEVEVEDRVIESTPKESKTLSFLQVASFKQQSEADKLRAKLILLNLPATVETTTNSKQQVWYRVIVGPFKSRSKLAKARSILASNRLNSLLLKRKP